MTAALKRWWWVALALLVVAGFFRLRFDVDVLNLLPSDEPTVRGLKLYQQHFANARELIVTLRASEAEKAERLAATLASQLRQQTNLIEKVTWQAPWSENPGQLAEFLGYIWLNQSPQAFSELTNRLAPANLDQILAEAKEALATSLSPLDIARRAFDPFDLSNIPALNGLETVSFEQGQKLFVSSDGTFRLLFVQARPELDSYAACAAWMKSVKAAVTGLQLGQKEWEGTIVRYTGRPVFVTEVASSMQKDLSGSITGTALIIAVLFWLIHRRWLPMFWLLALLAIVLAATVALGGLVLGSISVVSLGFAAVLLGLAVDYAVIHYQEALAHPSMSVPEIRRAIAPSILWSAITTICAFLALNLGGLPGLAQLGTLVAIGVALAAVVMVMIFLPPLFPQRRRPARTPAPAAWWLYFIPPRQTLSLSLNPEERRACHRVVIVTGAALLIALITLGLSWPGLDRSGDALKPRRGPAEIALEEMIAHMGIQNALWVVVPGPTESVVYQGLSKTEALLKQAQTNGVISRFLLPISVWPQPDHQDANRDTAGALAALGPTLKERAAKAGFNRDALFLTDQLLQTWANASQRSGVLWPTNPAAQWLLQRFVAHATNQWLAMGAVYPSTNAGSSGDLVALSQKLAENQVLLSGWDLLGAATLSRVRERLPFVVIPMLALVLTSLWLAFRRAIEILLGLAALLMGGTCLLCVMALAGWSWNLLNLMAVPLLLGTGVDYSIFMQMALRRYGGDAGLARRSIGRALLLCGGTAVAGFGSLAWSSYPGMASLGKVCAVGIAANIVVAVFLLPGWWRFACARSPHEPPAEAPPDQAPPAAPSSFYRAGLWRLGLFLVRSFPSWAVNAACTVVAEMFFFLDGTKRELVLQNLLPACSNNRDLAAKTVHRLYRNFAVKLADLWRVESGVPAPQWISDPACLDVIQAARQRQRGILFITLHLGNWEHGGLQLSPLGLRLTVLTLAEPDEQLTQLRMASRARWGIDTLILGKDSFGLLEVVQRLERGEALAMAMDRPSRQNPVRVELFERTFAASPLAAELARMTGCALIGVTIVRRPEGIAVRVLPEFTYDRQALGKREARRDLIQQIMRAMEPEIRQHLDQWYQFTPIWLS